MNGPTTARIVCALMLLAAAAGAAARSARADEIVFKNGDRVTGKITQIEGGKVTIQSDIFGAVTANLADLQSATTMPTTAPTTSPATAPTTSPTTSPATLPTTSPTTSPTTAPAIAAAPTAPSPPPKLWSGNVAVAGVLTRGNSDTETLAANFTAIRKFDNGALTLSGGYAYGEQKDKATGDHNVTTNNWFGQARLDHNWTDRLYYDYAMIRVEQDQVANLDVRVTPGVGVGYRWFNTDNTHFFTEVGASWVYEQYSNDGSNEHFALRFAYHLDKKLNDKVSLVHNLEYLPSVSDLGDFNLNTDAGIRAMLTQTMFIEAKVELKYDATPAPGAEKNDVRYTLGFGWNF